MLDFIMENVRSFQKLKNDMAIKNLIDILVQISNYRTCFQIHSIHIILLYCFFPSCFFFWGGGGGSCNMIPLVGSFQTTTDSFSNNDYVACVLK